MKHAVKYSCTNLLPSGNNGIVWATVTADIYDPTDARSLHANVTFRFPIRANGPKSLDQLSTLAIAAARSQMLTPASLLPDPKEWHAPVDSQQAHQRPSQGAD